jgi:hypothetical protein
MHNASNHKEGGWSDTYHPTSIPKSPQIVPGSAWRGFVTPISFHAHATTPGPSHAYHKWDWRKDFFQGRHPTFCRSLDISPRGNHKGRNRTTGLSINRSQAILLSQMQGGQAQDIPCKPQGQKWNTLQALDETVSPSAQSNDSAIPPKVSKSGTSSNMWKLWRLMWWTDCK